MTTARQMALSLVTARQAHFTQGLEALASPFTRVQWLRDEGRHGGGTRTQAPQDPFFSAASVNVSQVHYDDEPQRRLASATALSTIVHPAHPLLPSLHLHVSLTQLREGTASWRLMADLNPSHELPAHTARFTQALTEVLGASAAAARAQGDRYFFIPALQRHRGVVHFYVEAWTAEDGAALADRFAQTTIDTYLSFLSAPPPRAPTDAERLTQLRYHTLYLFQVLTLDRGTTSGLLIHDQNDVGIMGSLPSRVDPALLKSWEPLVPEVQRALVRALVAALPPGGTLDDEVRARLAQVVRAHYQAHPEALALQASGDVVPPTVANHR